MTSPGKRSARWASVIAALLALPIVVVTGLGTRYWPGRPFPGFLVEGNGFVPTIAGYGWSGIEAGVPFHARVVAVDGRAVRTNRDVYDYVAGLPVGTAVRYTLSKQDATVVRVVPTMRFSSSDYWLTVGLFVAFGVLSIGAGLLVAFLQAETGAARAFLSQGFFTGIFALTGTSLYHPDLWALSSLHFVSHAMVPAAFIHFGLVFPDARPFVARQPKWLLAPYVVSLTFAAWTLADFARERPTQVAYDFLCLYTAFGIVVLLGLVIYAYYENRTPLVRPRLHVVLPGLLLGTALGLYGFINISRSGGNFPINLIALAPPLFYASVGYAIVKHDLFDIDHLVKQAAVYGTLTLAITAVYAAALEAVSWLLPAEAGIPTSFHVAFIVLAAVFFQPLRTAAQNVVDRTFYRNRLDYRRTVSEVSAALTSLLDLDEILGRVGRTVTDGLQLESLAVVLWIDGQVTVWRYDERSGQLQPTTQYDFAALRRELARDPKRPWHGDGLAADASSAASEDAARLGAVLIVPMVVHGETIGAFALGRRRSGRGFSREDVDLLTTLAAQSAVAVQNAHSYRALQALNEALEAKVRLRTAELQASNGDLERAYEELKTAQAQLLTTEKMASLGLVVAGVAHEINNPLSFIVGNVEPLHQTLARVRGLATVHRDADLSGAVDRLTRILQLITLGAERTAAIVQDLRTFSRLGEAEARPTDLHDAIEVSLRLLRPRWVNRIAIHRDYGLVGPVDVIPGQINQVFMNLLANACDAIRGPGNVWIRTARDAGRVVISIRDDGAGIAPEHVSRVFDPFFTTKPVGQGTGLGLAITQGIVGAHGGSIRVTTESGKGTEFQIALPADGRRDAAMRGGG